MKRDWERSVAVAIDGEVSVGKEFVFLGFYRVKRKSKKVPAIKKILGGN